MTASANISSSAFFIAGVKDLKWASISDWFVINFDDSAPVLPISSKWEIENILQNVGHALK